MIPLISALILALSAFLLGFAWGRRVPDPEPEPVVYRDQVTVTMVRGDDGWLVDGLATTPAPE